MAETAPPELILVRGGDDAAAAGELLLGKRMDAFVDVSGSTAGALLANEVAFVKGLHAAFQTPECRIVAWNDSAKVLRSPHGSPYDSPLHALEGLGSGGGTNPCRFVPLLDPTQACIVTTDGEISSDAMAQLERDLEARLHRATPVVILLVLKSTRHVSVGDLQAVHGISMSIPQAFVRISGNVLILVGGEGGAAFVLMSKGCFAAACPAPAVLHAEAAIEGLERFLPSSLASVRVDAEGPRAGFVAVPGVVGEVCVEALYHPAVPLPLEVVRGLTNRALVAELDLRRLQTKVVACLQAALADRQSQELQDVKAQLIVEAAAAPGSAAHMALVARCQELLAAHRAARRPADEYSAALADLHAVVNGCLTSVVDFAAGSNRALRARVLDGGSRSDFGAGVEGDAPLAECPLLCEREVMCVLVRPVDTAAMTTDWAMECPFAAGARACRDALLPGYFGATIAATLLLCFKAS